jgi:hypothetical protein
MARAAVAALTLIGACGLGTADPEHPAARSSGSAPASFAVVELFTSEGCSSCPPIDQVLGNLAREAQAGHSPVYALSFHVTYWDHLGWKDPFGHPEFDARQRRYAAVAGSQVYTPQMFVNATRELNGRQRLQAKTVVEKVLRSPSGHVRVSVMAEETAPGKLRAQYRVAGAAPGMILNLALVEKGLRVPVKRGENGGRTLRHENVVRAFKVIPIQADSGSAEFGVPADLHLERTALIAYAQNPATLEISGAGSAAVRPAPERPGLRE